MSFCAGADYLGGAIVSLMISNLVEFLYIVVAKVTGFSHP